MHLRQQIRAQVVTNLTGLTTTGSNVYDSPVYDVETLPCLAVYTTSDAIDQDWSNNEADYHDLTITIEARAKNTTNVANVIDTICEEVETAIFVDPTLNGKAKDIEPVDTNIELRGETDKPVAMATMTFLVSYRVARGTPGTAVN